MVRKLLFGIIVFISFIVLMVVTLYLFRPFFHFIHPVKADQLIIEAWISPFEIEQAVQMINSDSISRVVIVGRNYPEDSNLIISAFDTDLESGRESEEGRDGGIWLLTNSSLVFNFMAIPVACELDDSLKIEVRAKGTESAGFFAHFNLIVNGDYQSGSFTTANSSIFSFIVKQPSNGLQSVIIHFDNDLVHHNQDRNLNVISVKVGDTEIEANDQCSHLIKNSGKYANGFNSQPLELMHYLVQAGVQPEKISTISFEPVSRNQTLLAARTIKNSPFITEINSVNIISSGIHSRRTWFTYKKILGDDIQVGVINFGQSDFIKGTKAEGFSKFLLLADEAFAYLINWFYLSFGGV